MSLSLENAVNKKVANTFAELGLDNKFASVKVSDRPDLSGLWPKVSAKIRARLPALLPKN